MTHPNIRAATDRVQYSPTAAVAAVQPATSAPAADAPLNVRLGWQLRTARDAQRLDIEDCAQALRLPAHVLRKLEAGDYTGISEGVYLRNYLTSYGAHLGVPADVIHAAIPQLAPIEVQPTLVSTGGIPRAHYLWHRYTTFATYAVLTAVIVVPLVWLGLKGGLDRELTRLEPLNASPVVQQASSQASTGTQATDNILQPRADKPLMASMAPFSALHRVDADASTEPAPAVSTVDAGSHTLGITLSGPSWVEVTTATGKHLQYSLLPAGTHKVYTSAEALQVSIGDTAAASIDVDGEPVDLARFQHANVAHFSVAIDAGKAVVQSN